ncbi:MAG: nucleoside hydrolase [Deinococcus sp.]|nr:nucleoside hydrolase [Deinococcus sp.]
MVMKIILDCDPGHDDAVAMLLACQHLEVLGITTVSGNVPLERTTENALKVVELGGIKVPVVRGAHRPLVREPHHALDIHGRSGLDGPELPQPVTPLHGQHAVEFIIDTVLATDEVRLVPTGPLTNIALALRLEPRLAKRVPEISLMGGSLTFGNRTAAAEFNIYADPEAAQVVFTSGIPIKMSGLNLTHQAGVGRSEIAQLRQLGNRTGTVVAAMLEFAVGAYAQVYDQDYYPLHDPCAVAALIDPSLIQFQPYFVQVMLEGPARGMTLCDQRRRGAPYWQEPNAQVGIKLDRKRFFDLLIDTLRQYP